MIENYTNSVMHIHRRLAERLIESYHVLVMSRLFHLFLRLSICMFYLSVFEKALLVIDMKWIQFIEQKTVRERCYLYFGAKNTSFCFNVSVLVSGCL